MVGVVPGEGVEIARLPTWCWACPICNMVTMTGALVCFGCQSVCLFALRHGDMSQYTLIGENTIRSTMKAVYSPILIRDTTQEMKVSLRTAASSERCPGDTVKHQA